MSVFTPINVEESKVHNAQYIRTGNTPDEGAKPEEPAKPEQPETK